MIKGLSRFEKLTIAGVLLVLALGVCIVAGLFAYGTLTAPKPARAGQPSTPTAPPAPTVTPEDDGWIETITSNSYVSSSGSCATVQGEARNTSDETLRYVTVIVSLYDEDDVFLASESNFIEFRSLAPGETSPWRVINCFPRAAALGYYRIGYRETGF